MKTVLIQYIGKGASKIDNVRAGSGRYWPKRGTALEIPDVERYSYLAHPDVFREISAETYAAEAALSQDGLTAIKAALAPMSAGGVKEVLSVVQDELTLKIEMELKPESTPPRAPVGLTAADVANSNDAGTMLAYDTRIRSVANAIREIDLKNDELAINGRPTPEAVRDMLGGNIPTEDEIAEAMYMLGAKPRFASAVEAGVGLISIEPLAIQPQLNERHEKAQAAIADLPDADRETMLKMAEVFGIKVKKNTPTGPLRNKLREALELI